MPISVKDLLEAGCHFGHQTKRWNPKMKEFVYGSKNGISIIDLTKTIHQIADACNFLQRTVMNGGNILFVGTKRQAQQIVKEAAEATNMDYVAERWMGGILTNNVTIRKSIKRMQEIDAIVSDEAASGLKKKEIVTLTRQTEKLHRDLDGIANMKRLPDVLIVIDVCHNYNAVKEAQKLNIPIVAIVDTNGDPEGIDYPIAANDDAVKSIKVIMDTFLEAIKDALELYGKRAAEERAKIDAAKAEKAKSDAAAPKKRPAAKGGAKRPAAKRAPKKADAETAPAAGEEAAAKKPARKKAAPAAETAAPAAEEAK
ncbi:MAG: 30S ribosomal protein S2 [Victivallales bacterium]